VRHLAHLPIATVALYAFINPAIAVVLGAVVLREPFSARNGMACAVVLAGTAIVKSTETKADVSAR
jgi:drug/metabolite transporter (DMT)-like permease